MSAARSDRPTSVPTRDAPEPAPPPSPARIVCASASQPFAHRWRSRTRGPHLVPVAAVQRRLVALRAQQDQPTPEPTRCFLAVYEHVAPSVVQVVAGSGGRRTPGGRPVRRMATSSPACTSSTEGRRTVTFSDGTVRHRDRCAPARSRIAVCEPSPRGSVPPATMGNPGGSDRGPRVRHRSSIRLKDVLGRRHLGLNAR